MTPAQQWWLTKTGNGRRVLARMVPARAFEQMTGHKHPSTVAREDKKMTSQDRREFEMYLKRCTDSQVLGVLATEREARRWDYADLAKTEARVRRLDHT